MERTKERKKDKGFTLIEILIAILLLAFIALGIMALLPQGYRQITSAGRISSMNHIAQMQMDRLRSLPYGDSDLNAGLHPTPTFPDWVTFTRDGETQETYSVEWDVDENVPRTNMKSITVTVGHNIYGSASGNPADQRSVTFHTYINR